MKKRLLLIEYVMILSIFASFKFLTVNNRIISKKGNEEIAESEVLAYITDCSSEYDLEFHKEETLLYGENTYKFIIQPVDSETEIIVSEIECIDDEIHEVKERIRTKERLILVMEPSGNTPYVQVKVQNSNRNSCWIPLFDENYGELIVPEEFKVLGMK